MVRNYLITAYRSLKNRPGITAINVLGLAVGLAACLLIGLWVQQQLSYDAFHPKADNVYRVALDVEMQGRQLSAPVAPAPMASTLRRDVPEVEAAVRLRGQPEVSVQIGDRGFTEDRVYAADSSFFSVFSGFELLRGNPETALTNAEAVVLTQSTAERYFGQTDVMGQTIQIDGATRRVTGVIADVPPTSHFQFDLLMRLQVPPQLEATWMANSFHTYVRLREDHNRTAFAEKLQGFVETYVGPQAAEALGVPAGQWLSQNEWRYFPQRLTEIYLHSDLQDEMEAVGSIAYVWTFSAVALFILLIACINFTNLVTARATERAGEVGMRKALGAQPGQLVGQFLGEALLTTSTAFVIAIIIASAALPSFNNLAGTQLSLSTLVTGPLGLGALVGVALVSLVAGSYPAFVLSSFRPAEVLKGADRSRSSGPGRWLRQGLVVVQFTVSIALIVGTLVVWNQFDYIQTKRLGLDKEHVVAIEQSQPLEDQQDTFKDEVRQLQGVVGVGGTDRIFDNMNNTFAFFPDDRPGENIALGSVEVDHHFVDVMDIEVTTGRNFDPARTTDTTAALVNQAAVEALGWDDPIGHTLGVEPNDESPYRVVGVVENFHLRSLRQRIDPLVLTLSETPNQVLVRMQPGATSETLAGLEATWQTFAPGTPLSYDFLDARFDALHADTQRMARLFIIFAGLAIAIACFGLFGLATYTAQRRKKEVGIRKALGATATQIVHLLSVDFLKLVGVAFAVAAPLAYWAMQRWLQDFAYRTDIGVGLFLGAGALAFAIALLTVGTQALRAARLDPATTLRDE
jgi:putative ABC transport system permease protein